MNESRFIDCLSFFWLTTPDDISQKKYEEKKVPSRNARKVGWGKPWRAFFLQYGRGNSLCSAAEREKQNKTNKQKNTDTWSRKACDIPQTSIGGKDNPRQEQTCFFPRPVMFFHPTRHILYLVGTYIYVVCHILITYLLNTLY